MQRTIGGQNISAAPVAERVSIVCSKLSPIPKTPGCLRWARACVAALGLQLQALKSQILAFDRRIMAWHRSNETSKRLDAIPGVGPAVATGRAGQVSIGLGLTLMTLAV